ncbi:MAG: putative protein N(5)-glutamine methyltransferase [Euzebya sp.]
MSRPARRQTIANRLRVAGCIYADEEARLLMSAARGSGDLADLVDRRVAGEPLEYLLGWAQFRGRTILLEPGVFIPRERTEFLVDQGAALIEKGPKRTVVVDLCCGSGAVGAALAAACGPLELHVELHVELHSVDIDPSAVRCARRNLAVWGGTVYLGDLYQPLPSALRGRVDVLVANAPYVPSAAIAMLPWESRRHEPLIALDGGADGLDVQRGVIAGASEWLAPDGHVLVETSRDQASATLDIADQAGLQSRLARQEAIDATVVIAAPAGPRRQP